MTTRDETGVSPIAGVVRFDVTEADLAAIREEYSGLTADTPEGYESTRLAIGNCRKTRVAIESRRKDLKRDALTYGRAVDSAAKQLTALVEAIEAPLKERKLAVDDEKERVAREEREAEQRAIEAERAAEREVEEARMAAERKELAAERAAMARDKL